METEVRLIENFVSWQGEGPNSGQTMIILRFKTCNLRCPWCDTSVKMRVSAESSHYLSDIQETINTAKAGLLITGGEPTVDRHISDTITLLNELNYPIANVESNGYDLENLIKAVDPTKPVKYIYSPKIFSIRDRMNELEKTERLLGYPNVFVKVVYDQTDYVIQYLDRLYRKVGIDYADRVWLMPKGSTLEELLKNSGEVFNACEKYRFNFSSRNHIIYGFV